MKKFSTFIFSAIALVLMSMVSVAAQAATDKVSYDLLKPFGSSLVTVGPGQGLVGTYYANDLYYDDGAGTFELYSTGKYMRCSLPEGYKYTGISLEGAKASASGTLWTVYASSAELDNTNYTSGTLVGEFTSEDLAAKVISGDDIRYLFIYCNKYNLDVTAINFEFDEPQIEPEVNYDVVSFDVLKQADTYGTGAFIEVGPSQGLTGTYYSSKLYYDNGASTFELYNTGEYIRCALPEGYAYTGISVEGAKTGATGDLWTVYASSAELTSPSGTLVGTFSDTDLEPKVITGDDTRYLYIHCNNYHFDVNAIKFEFKKVESGTEPEPGGKEVTDHITFAGLLDQNPDMNTSASGYMDVENANAELNFTGESGAEYKLTQVACYSNIFANVWDYPNPAGEFYNTASAGYIKSINFQLSYVDDEIAFRVSDEPITAENKYDAKEVILQKTNGVMPTWTADGLYKYFYVTSSQRLYTDVAVAWSSDEPELTCQAPSINCWDEPVVPGSTIYISSENGYSTDVTVTVNDVKDEELSKVYTESSISIAAPGKVGDVVKVEAFCTAPGFNDSEVTTQSWTLDMPQAARPQLSEYTYETMAGQKLVIASETENATITCSMELVDWNNSDNNKTYETVSGTTPLTITVPDDVIPGTVFHINAYAEAEGYRQSNTMEEYLSVISDVLQAPNFNLVSGKEVEAGTVVTISAAAHANAIHYTINDGEEQVVNNTMVEIAITEDMDITAWNTGEEPFKASEKVSASYTVEKFNENMDVIVPTVFETSDDALNDYTFNTHNGTLNGIDYVYNGGLYKQNDKHTFYYYPEGTILYNDTEFEDGVKAVKVSSLSSWSNVYIMVSDEPITEITSEMADWDFENTEHAVRVRVGCSDYDPVADYGDWVNISDYVNNPKLVSNENADPEKMTFVPKYVAVYRFGSMTNYVTRIIIEREHISVGINGIDAENDANGAIYNINGMRVDRANMAPGIYIRKDGKKATKFVVK